MKDALGSVESVVVFGAASDIAGETVRLLASNGARDVVLASRKPERLEPLAAVLRGRWGASVRMIEFDADAFDTHDTVVADAFRDRDVDLVLVAFGVLGDQSVAERDGQAAIAVVRTNFVGAVSVLVPVAERMRAQGHGTIAVLSSVAGERGRASNFVYGSSKAGLDVFCQGLGDRLHGSGVTVVVVRPGFVRSKMTAGMRARPLSASPRDVAVAIVAAIRSGRETVWVPSTLRWVMSGLRHLPRSIFRRLDL
jgi:decaprenylphospho-beta-D-erythro-pentofuranosid-2-ulose 2-reductase